MDNDIISVSSITHATRARNLLQRHGIRADIGRRTDSDRVGCGYFLRVSGDKNRALTLLRRAGIRIADGSDAI